MQVSGQLHAPTALSPGKEPPVPIAQEAGWALKLVWMWWQKENIPVPVRNQTPVIQPEA